RHEPLTLREHVGVVMRARQSRRLLVPAEGAANTGNAIRHHRFAVPGPTEYDATHALAPRGSLRRRTHEERVVYGFRGIGAEVHDFVSPFGKLFAQSLLV